MLKHNIKLVVVDSVAATLRYGFSIEAEQMEDQQTTNEINNNQHSNDPNNKKRKPLASESSSNSSKKRCAPKGLMARVDREAMVLAMGQALKKVASQFDAVVVCINQVSANISQSGGDSAFNDVLSLVPIATGSEHGMEKAFMVDESQSRGNTASHDGFSSATKPALGLLWASCVNTRICISKSKYQDVGSGDDSETMKGGIRKLVTRRRLSVVFTPNGPSGGSGVEFIITEKGLVGIK
ncbi:hypothetical protein BDR26DRAFT_851955 [Obelidium mucronatum]|nr:hypothetical protein BDR26DRAFT_851955 [Obelidium mucronatum]